MRKLIVLAVLALFCLSGLFALNGLVTWTWFENDPNVEYFRYQVDGEEEDKWTVVDWSVNEVTILLDITVLHELHLQQSYDGENWSESSVVVSEVFTEDAFDQSTEEDLLLEDGTEDSTGSETLDFTEQKQEEVQQPEEEPEETVEEVEAVPEVPKYLPVRALDYGIGYLNSIPDNAGPKTMGLFVAYTRTFVKVRDIFDVGLKANVSLYSSFDVFTQIQSTKLISYANVLATVTTLVGNSDIYFSFGPDVGLDLESLDSPKVGVSAELGIRYHRSPKFSLGLAIADHHYFLPAGDATNRFDLRVFMSSVF